MNKYVVFQILDEGIVEIKETMAMTPRQAIAKWDLYPFTWPDDWLHLLPEDFRFPEDLDEDELDEMTQEEVGKYCSWEQALNRVCKFYNLDSDLNWKAYDEGNYIDGDSNSHFAILEITRDLKLRFFPRQFSYVGERIILSGEEV